MNQIEKAIRTEAIEQTYLQLLELHPDQKKLLNIIRKIKLEQLQKSERNTK